jgi:hypothetical protein
MPHWKLLIPKKYFSFVECDGKETTLKITRVTRTLIEKVREDENGKMEKCEERTGMLWFEGQAKSYILTTAVGEALAMMFGDDGSKWVGHQVTLYFPEETYFGVTAPRVRVKGSPEIKAPMHKVIRLGMSKYPINLVPTQ